MANILSTERINEHTTVHHLDDGTRQLILQAGQNYQDRDTGEWKAHEPSIALDNLVPGFSRSQKTAQTWKRFGKGRLRFGFKQGLYVTYAGRGMAAVDPVVSGDTATYADAWPSADLRVKVYPEGVKEDIILKDATAPKSFTFDLAELGAVNATQVGNTVEYIETLTGKVVGRIPEPFAVDAKGVRGPVTLTLAGSAVTLAVDSAWLADPARVWPVVLDPTTTIQPDPTAGKDAFISSVNPTANYGTDTNLHAGALASDKRRSLLQFALPAIPVGSAVSVAGLMLYLVGGDTGDYNIDAYNVTSTWDESTVNWNNQPSLSASASATVVASTTYNIWLTWSIISLVQGWVNGTLSNYGVVLVNASETLNNTSKAFWSSDYTTDTTLRPKLVITYTAAPTVSITSPNGTQSAPTQVNNDVTPDLVGVYSSVDSVNMAYHQHQVYDEANNLIWDSTKTAAAAAPGSTVTVTVPANLLKYNKKYRWRWMAWDANGGYSAWAEAWFISLMTAPVGLTATANTITAKVDLTWTAHTGENLAGYNVYRRKTGDTAWVKQNLTLRTTATYSDDVAASGQSYDYGVTAVASDGYESPQSTPVTGSVTHSKAWIDDLALEAVPRTFEPEDGWTGSVSKVIGRTLAVVFRKPAGRKLKLASWCMGKTNIDALRQRLNTIGAHRYVDPLGEVYRFEVVSALTYPKRAPFTSTDFTLYEWSVDVVEVA